MISPWQPQRIFSTFLVPISGAGGRNIPPPKPWFHPDIKKIHFFIIFPPRDQKNTFFGTFPTIVWKVSDMNKPQYEKLLQKLLPWGAPAPQSPRGLAQTGTNGGAAEGRPPSPPIAALPRQAPGGLGGGNPQGSQCGVGGWGARVF